MNENLISFCHFLLLTKEKINAFNIFSYFFRDVLTIYILVDIFGNASNIAIFAKFNKMSELKDNMKESIEATAATKYDFDFWSGLIVQVKSTRL